MNTQLLIDTAAALVADDKGVLAMDESHPTCNKRFAKLDIPQTEEARRAYRELLITTPDLGESISSVPERPRRKSENSGRNNIQLSPKYSSMKQLNHQIPSSLHPTETGGLAGGLNLRRVLINRRPAKCCPKRKATGGPPPEKVASEIKD